MISCLLCFLISVLFCVVVFGGRLTRRPHEGCYFCLRIENRAHKTHIYANGTWGLCWGGVGGVGWGGDVNVLSSAYSTYFYAPEISGMLATLHVATVLRALECLQRSPVVSLLRYMLLRCRDLWNACRVTCCYAAEISGMLAEISCGILATLHVATLPRALECLPRYMLLRCRDLWNACRDLLWYPCYVTCCYAAEISGMLATLHVATLPRSRDLWNACHVTCCYAAESSGMLATLHVATLQRSLECLQRSPVVSLLRYMLLRCRELWNACHVTCCYVAYGVGCCIAA